MKIEFMKTSVQIAVISILLLLFVGCETTNTVYTSDVSPATAEQLSSQSSLEEAVDHLNQYIGSYPPRIESDKHKAEIYQEWKKCLQEALALRQELGDTEKVLFLLGELYRQGHNMDVEGAASKAQAIYDISLSRFPDSYEIHLFASYFYLSINPRYAPKGEAILDRLREIVGNRNDFEVERGYLFAYLYQDRIDEAIQQAEHILTLKSDPMIEKILEGLRSGNIQRVHWE